MTDTGTEIKRAHKRHLIKTETYLPPRLFPSSSATSLDDDSDTPAVASVRAGEYTDIMSWYIPVPSAPTVDVMYTLKLTLTVRIISAATVRIIPLYKNLTRPFVIDHLRPTLKFMLRSRGFRT